MAIEVTAFQESLLGWYDQEAGPTLEKAGRRTMDVRVGRRLVLAPSTLTVHLGLHWQVEVRWT